MRPTITKQNYSLTALAAVFISATLAMQAGPVVSQYFPMNNGDSRYYQDHDAPINTGREFITQTTYNGHSVFSLNFHDQGDGIQLATDTWYLGNNGGALALYGIQTSWGSMSLNSPANLLTDQLLTNNGTTTSRVTGLCLGSTFDVTVQTTVSSVLGTCTVPAGTFGNCKLVLVAETASIYGIGFQNYDSAAWILAPGVGILKDGVATWDYYLGAFTFNDPFGNPQDYLELVSGTYTTQTGSLQVTINPSGAVSDGAQWQVDSGAWQNSGVTVSGLSVGSHTVAFKSISGWSTPGNQPLTISANQTTIVTATYSASGCLATLLRPAYGATVSLPPVFTWSLVGSCSVRVYFAASPNPITFVAAGDIFSPGTNTFAPTASWWIGLVPQLGAQQTYYWTVGNPDTQHPDAYAAWQPFTVTSVPSNYTIAVSASPSSGGTASGSGTFGADSKRTVTATARSGYAFDFWAEGEVVVTNSASYSFLVTRDRNLVANFRDVVVPSIAITAPLRSQRWSNAVFTVKGTAKDNAQMAGVWCQWNGVWGPVSTGNNWTNWAVDVPLVPGTNTIRAYAEDGYANRSATNSVSIIYVVSDRLAVAATGPCAYRHRTTTPLSWRSARAAP